MPLKSITSFALASALLSGMAMAEDATLPKLTVNEELRAKLPEEIKTAGKMISVNNGSFPPYEIVTGTEDGRRKRRPHGRARPGARRYDRARHRRSACRHSSAGVNSGRYQFAFGPVGDFKSREEANDFVDWVQEYRRLCRAQGQSERHNLAGDCLRTAHCRRWLADRRRRSSRSRPKSARPTARRRSRFNPSPTSRALSWPSGPSARMHSSPPRLPSPILCQQSNGQLELTGVGQKNGFEDLYQGAVVPKGSPLGPVLHDGMKVLMDNGTYAAIMKKWGLENNMIKEPGINLGGHVAKMSANNHKNASPSGGADLCDVVNRTQAVSHRSPGPLDADTGHCGSDFGWIVANNENFGWPVVAQYFFDPTVMQRPLRLAGTDGRCHADWHSARSAACHCAVVDGPARPFPCRSLHLVLPRHAAPGAAHFLVQSVDALSVDFDHRAFRTDIGQLGHQCPSSRR